MPVSDETDVVRIDDRVVQRMQPVVHEGREHRLSALPVLCSLAVLGRIWTNPVGQFLQRCPCLYCFECSCVFAIYFYSVHVLWVLVDDSMLAYGRISFRNGPVTDSGLSASCSGVP